MQAWGWGEAGKGLEVHSVLWTELCSPEFLLGSPSPRGTEHRQREPWGGSSG